MEAALLRLEGGFDAIILSDYRKGALSERLCQCLIAEARRRAIPILVDTQGARFPASTVGPPALTPNRHEFDAPPAWAIRLSRPSGKLVRVSATSPRPRLPARDPG